MRPKLKRYSGMRATKPPNRRRKNPSAMDGWAAATSAPNSTVPAMRSLTPRICNRPAPGRDGPDWKAQSIAAGGKEILKKRVKIPSNRQNDLADGPAPVEHGGGVRRALERKRRVDARVQLALRDPAQDVLHVAAVPVGIALHGFAPEHADRRHALEQQQVQRDLRDLARRKADD